MCTEWVASDMFWDSCETQRFSICQCMSTMQQMNGIGFERIRGIFRDKGDKESGQSINRQGLSS